MATRRGHRLGVSRLLYFLLSTALLLYSKGRLAAAFRIGAGGATDSPRPTYDVVLRFTWGPGGVTDVT